MSVLTKHAYAKINLGLRIIGRRDDGYHDIITRMQRISLGDEVTLEPLPGRIVYDGPELTDRPDQNLCVKAARAFQKRFGDEFGVLVQLNKRIPAGAGLGGGSSDAAAVLNGMAEIYEIPQCDDRLKEAAMEVGADVPFFLSGHSSAVAQGIGERLTPVQGLDPNVWIAVIWSKMGISTSWAYELVDKSLTFDEKDISIHVLEQFFQHRAIVPTDGDFSGKGVNDFEEPIFSVYPELSSACDYLCNEGAVFAGLSGSGSALYGIFDDEVAIRDAVQRLVAPWVGFICNPC
ncbi:MAG: 4-(cytidine 5'-diphospho)-2-C-methyl-D-erythritol kinase [Candidatus Electryoneaceae bacterium]|nr:4-(cytidine 5'-diphospho)-2-C-methyl-D-erythritol kinase [Candidatus Electryoneaceae bacterium]